MRRLARSVRYYCSADGCTASIEVVGPARDDYRALTRVDWSLLGGEALCRRHTESRRP